MCFDSGRAPWGKQTDKPKLNSVYLLMLKCTKNANSFCCCNFLNSVAQLGTILLDGRSKEFREGKAGLIFWPCWRQASMHPMHSPVTEAPNDVPFWLIGAPSLGGVRLPHEIGPRVQHRGSSARAGLVPFSSSSVDWDAHSLISGYSFVYNTYILH